MAEHITITDLSLQYSASGPVVLSSLSLDVEAGSCLAVIGPTGAGKSSLLHCLAGTIRRHHPESVSSGRIQIGRLSFEGPPERILFPTAGLVLQDPYVQISGVTDTVFDEVSFTLENLGPISEDARMTILPTLQKLGIDHLADRRPTTLSGGETQRVALAAILIAQPSLLLLDEPTTALDSNAQEMLGIILRSLRSKTTIILTDTQLDFALAVADRLIVLENGKVVFQGGREKLFSQLQGFLTSLPVETWLRAEPYIRSLQKNPSVHQKQVARALGLS